MTVDELKQVSDNAYARGRLADKIIQMRAEAERIRVAPMTPSNCVFRPDEYAGPAFYVHEPDIQEAIRALLVAEYTRKANEYERQLNSGGTT